MKFQLGLWSKTPSKYIFVVATMLLLSGWLYFRISTINPVILQDEWVYVVSSKTESIWSQTPAYNFGNYLFNLVYSMTNLCGTAFYSCAKIMNILFVSTFALSVFWMALKFLPFGWSYLLLVATYLSPISIYASMYLPESMYFALLAMSIIPIIERLKGASIQMWIWAGALLGLAALAKPHTLFSVAAVGIFLLIFEASAGSNVRQVIKSALFFAVAFLLARLGVGLAIAGPKALDVFGTYGAGSAVGEFATSIGSTGSSNGNSIVGAGPVAGALNLFIPQLTIHSLVLAALLGCVLCILVLTLLESITKKQQSPVTSFALLMVIWLVLMLIVVALFTGWITGQGDDHRDRVLLRYYEFILPIAAVPAMAYLYDSKLFAKVKVVYRIPVAVLFFVMTTASFSGFFGRLEIQIADAPSIAGLISDASVWNWVGVVTAVGLVALAFYPRQAPYIVLTTFVLSMAGMGYQTQNQYLDARGNRNSQDIAGQYVRDFVPQTEHAEVVVLANSRFAGRVASFWLETNNDLLILPPGTSVEVSDLPAESVWVLALDETSLEAPSARKIAGEGFILYEVTDK